MVSVERFRRYKELRWAKPPCSWVQAHRPLSAKHAWYSLREEEVRRAKQRLLPPLDFDYDASFVYCDHTITVKRYLETEYDPLDGFATFRSVTAYERQHGCDRNSGRYAIQGIAVNQVFDLDYDEDMIARDARRAGVSRGVAREMAIADRRAAVEYVRDVYKGNISFTSVIIEVDDPSEDPEWLGPYEDNSSDEMNRDVEDALRSVLRQISESKAAP